MNAAGAAAELSAAAERFITQQLSAVPPELELRPSSTGVGVGVWSKQSISRGTRYGPFLGKWTANAKDPSLAWEVSTLHRCLGAAAAANKQPLLVWRPPCGSGGSSWGLLSADF